MAIEFDDHINLNQSEIKGAVLEKLASAPVSPVEGQIYYDTTLKQERIYNGTTWTVIGVNQSQQYSAGGAASIGTTTYTHTYNGLTIGAKYMIMYQSFVLKTGGSVSADVSASISGASTTWGSISTVGRQNYAMATGEIYIFAAWVIVTATDTTIAVSINGTFTGSGTPTFYDISTIIERK